jgi:hypothetical protein
MDSIPSFNKRWLFSIALVVVLAIAGFFYAKKNQSSGDSLSYVTTGHNSQVPDGNTASSYDEATEIMRVKAEVKKNIADFSNLQFTIEYDSPDELLDRLNDIQSAHKYHSRYQDQDKELDRLLENEHKLLERITVKYYPIARYMFLNNIQKNYWKDNIDARITGSKDDEICFTGKALKDMQLREKIYNEIYNSLFDYRFKKVKLETSDGEWNSSTHDITSFADNDVF